MLKRLLLLTLSVVSFNVFSEEIYYAGFSYLGDHGDIELNYPYTGRLNSSNDGSQFDKALLDKLSQRSDIRNKLVVSELADMSSEAALSVTLALESELTSVEQVGDKYKILLQVSAQLMLFDVKNMQIVKTYPIDVQFIDVASEKPTDEYLQALYRKFYFENSSINIFDIFLDQLNSISTDKKYSNHLRVVKSTLNEAVPPQLPEGLSEDQVAEMMGQSFTRFLSSNQDVSVLPFKKGHAVGNKISGRFASGEVYMMQIPEPDYSIALELTGLKKKQHSQNSAGSAWIYAAQVKFKFYEELSGDIIFEDKLFNASTKAVPTSVKNVNDGAAFNETLLMLFSKFTASLSKPKKSWLKKHAGDSDQYSSYKLLTKVIAECR